MAKINFDVVDEHGGPTVTFGIDFDHQTSDEIAAQLGLSDAGGKALAAALAALQPDAKGQALLNKVVASAVKMTVKTIANGGNASGILAALGG